MERLFLILCGINGVLGVGLGAFGAHGLSSRLSGLPDAAKRLEWWQTASHYHLVHALALAVSAYLTTRSPGTAAQVSGWAFLVGIALFSGSLYTMTLTGTRALGAITPLGGLGFLVGWAAVVVAAWRLG